MGLHLARNTAANGVTPSPRLSCALRRSNAAFLRGPGAALLRRLNGRTLTGPTQGVTPSAELRPVRHKRTQRIIVFVLLPLIHELYLQPHRDCWSFSLSVNENMQITCKSAPR